jgi:alanine-glyoxylate transaminase/serine-glyoxylate transaminase/serine-pyruvate transaminase
MRRTTGRNFLFVPGPTNVPDRVQRAMIVAMEDHRSSRFPDLSTSVLSDLKKVFKTEEGQAFIFPSSGTGAWEAALTNTLSPGDKILASSFGQFSFLWIDMAQRLGFDVEVQEVEWGEGVPLEWTEELLRADTRHEIKAILACHNETATGVTSDIGGLRRVMDDVGHPALLCVDAVSSLASIDFRMDEWRVDLAVSGSQKGLMLPAGLGILAVSPKALEATKTARSRRCYFDLADMIATNASGYFPYTPALPMLYGLREALDIIFEEGLEEIFARHHYLAEGVRAAITEGWELSLCAKAPKWHSDTVSAIVVPEGPLQGRRQGFPNRPPGRPERAHADGRDRRRRDGDARRRSRGAPGQRRRGGLDLLAQQRPGPQAPGLQGGTVLRVPLDRFGSGLSALAGQEVGEGLDLGVARTSHDVDHGRVGAAAGLVAAGTVNSCVTQIGQFSLLSPIRVCFACGRPRTRIPL